MTVRTYQGRWHETRPSSAGPRGRFLLPRPPPCCSVSRSSSPTRPEPRRPARRPAARRTRCRRSHSPEKSQRFHSKPPGQTVTISCQATNENAKFLFPPSSFLRQTAPLALSTMVFILISGPSCPGFDSQHSRNFKRGNNCGRCPKETEQWLENVDRTYQVLASGNRALQKTIGLAIPPSQVATLVL